MLGDPSPVEQDDPVGDRLPAEPRRPASRSQADAEAPRRMVGLELSALERATRDDARCLRHLLDEPAARHRRTHAAVRLAQSGDRAAPGTDVRRMELLRIRNSTRARCRRRPASTISRACATPPSPAHGPGMASTRTGCAPASTRRSRSARPCHGAAAGDRARTRAGRGVTAAMSRDNRISTTAENGPPPEAAGVLYPGEVMHARLKPFGHRFVYRVFSLLVDLDRLDELDRMSALFSVNKAEPRLVPRERPCRAPGRDDPRLRRPAAGRRRLRRACGAHPAARLPPHLRLRLQPDLGLFRL